MPLLTLKKSIVIMDPTADVIRRRRELNEHAYSLFVKALMFRDKPDTAIMGRLRIELCIDNATHKKYMSAYMSAKNSGTLSM